eukprot:968381-Prymnesium_polylepis.1
MPTRDGGREMADAALFGLRPAKPPGLVMKLSGRGDCVGLEGCGLAAGALRCEYVTGNGRYATTATRGIVEESALEERRRGGRER